MLLVLLLVAIVSGREFTTADFVNFDDSTQTVEFPGSESFLLLHDSAETNELPFGSESSYFAFCFFFSWSFRNVFHCQCCPDETSFS
jgi:hypothetical protein